MFSPLRRRSVCVRVGAFNKDEFSMMRMVMMSRLLLVSIIIGYYSAAASPLDSTTFCFAFRSSSPILPDNNNDATVPVTAKLIHQDQITVQQQLGYLPQNYVAVSARKLQSNEPVAIQTYPLHGGAQRRQAKSLAGAVAAVLGDDKNNNNNKENKDKDVLVVGTPFPTLYWLTCPDISRAVAELERTGFIRVIEKTLQHSEPELVQRLLRCHQEYGKQRWNSLSVSDQSILLDDTNHPSMRRIRDMIEYSGISGTNFTTMMMYDTEDKERDDEEDKDKNDIDTPNDCGVTGTVATARDTKQIPCAPAIKCLHAHYAHYRSTLLQYPESTINPVGEMIHDELTTKFPDLAL